MRHRKTDILLERHLRHLHSFVQHPTRHSLPVDKGWGKAVTPMGSIKSQATRSAQRAPITLPKLPWKED